MALDPNNARPVRVIDSSGNVADLNASAGDLLTLTPTLDTAAYAAGDVLFDFIALANVVTAAGRMSLLQSLVAADKADTGVTITLLFANAAASLGAANAAPSISDADSFKISGSVSIAAADWIDLGGCRVASLRNLGLILKPAAGMSSYVAALVTAGGAAGTFGANDLQFGFGILKG